jgi:hypothetical protein
MSIARKHVKLPPGFWRLGWMLPFDVHATSFRSLPLACMSILDRSIAIQMLLLNCYSFFYTVFVFGTRCRWLNGRRYALLWHGVVRPWLSLMVMGGKWWRDREASNGERRDQQGAPPLRAGAASSLLLTVFLHEIILLWCICMRHVVLYSVQINQESWWNEPDNDAGSWIFQASESIRIFR